MEKLSPMGWALRPLQNYANFSGRASRAEFWWFFLFAMIAYFGMILLLGVTVGGLAALGRGAGAGAFASIGVLGILIILFWLALLIPMIAVQMRRLHDTNRSGWWLGAYYLFYLIYLFVTLGAAFSSAGAGGRPGNLGAVAMSGIVALVFFVYSIVLLVFFCLRGTQGANRFGEDPHGANVEEVFA